jgi:hypothetical protein
MTMPDPADRLIDVTVPRPPVAVDVEKLRAIVTRVERYQGAGLRPAEVEQLAAGVRAFAPEGVLDRRAERPLPSVMSMPACSGCGTSVPVHGDRCARCREKDAARPRPLFETGPQQAPAYAPKADPTNPTGQP